MESVPKVEILNFQGVARVKGNRMLKAFIKRTDIEHFAWLVDHKAIAEKTTTLRSPVI